MNFTNEAYDIIIQAGQSNAEGCGRGPVTEEYTPDGDIMYLYKNYTNEDKIVHGEKVSETVAKLEKCEGCYVLRTKDDPARFAGKIYVYQLEGYFYFILFRHIDDQWADRTNYTNFRDGA